MDPSRIGKCSFFTSWECSASTKKFVPGMIMIASAADNRWNRKDLLKGWKVRAGRMRQDGRSRGQAEDMGDTREIPAGSPGAGQVRSIKKNQK